MPTITTHAPGTINWPELGTTDQDAAKKYYSALFGWKFNDTDMGEQGTYTIFTRDGVDVAALFTLQPDMLKQGVPPNWATYITVESADAAAAKAKSLGGTIIVEPFDVMEHGRMAVIQDPQGAVFSVWQAKKHIGVSVLGEPNSLGWTQLNAKDTAKAKAFYTALVGWKTQDDPMGPEFGGGYYTTFMKADGPAGGMMAIPPMPGSEHIPSHWLPYFAVSDVDASTAKALSLGGKQHVPPTDIPGTGRFSVLADPQGASFALIKFLPRG
jgi:hypothetical protein